MNLLAAANNFLVQQEAIGSNSHIVLTVVVNHLAEAGRLAGSQDSSMAMEQSAGISLLVNCSQVGNCLSEQVRSFGSAVDCSQVKHYWVQHRYWQGSFRLALRC